MSFSPKYPPKFQAGERVLIVAGGYRGHLVTVKEIRPGWPYANYTVEHETEGSFNLNERELGTHRETSDDTPATPGGREARRVEARRAKARGEKAS